MKILFVEDDADDAELIGRLLYKGARLLQLDLCDTVADAVRCLEQAGDEPYEVVLTDLKLPDGNGLDILAYLREKDLHIPIVVLTGSGDQEAVVSALRMGVADYIRKGEPYMDQLPAVLMRAMERHHHIDERRLQHIRVLYAEHDSQDINFTRRQLEKNAKHISLEIARDGETAFSLLAEHPPDHYDVVMFDYHLPGCSGLDALKQIHIGMGLQVPVIIVTGVGEEQAAVESMRLGAASFITKDEGYLRRLPAEIESAHLRSLSMRDHVHLQLLEKALEAADNGIVITDPRRPDNPVVFVNSAFERISGYSREDLIGRNCRFLQGDDRDQKGLAPLQDAMTYGQPVRTELVNYRKTGDSYWVSLSITPIRDAAGNITNFVGVAEDISERKQNESAQRLAAKVFESFNEAVFITDAERRVVQVNQAFSRITGYAPSEVIGRPMAMLEGVVAGERDKDTFRDQLATKGYWHGESTARRSDGTPYPVWLSVSNDSNDEGRVQHYIVCFYDITDFKESQQRLQYLVNYDNLTGLLNRNLFDDRLVNAIDHARRRDQRLAVMFIDLDDFKLVNDTLGHQAGDALLKVAADRLRVAVRSEDSVCRVGGDEFMILLTALEEPEQAARTASRILESMTPPIDVEGHNIVLTASIGIALYPDDGTDGPTLIRKADTAMFKAKEQGRNLYKYFTEEMNAEVYDRLVIEQYLRGAIEDDQLYLVFQPRVRMSDNAVVGLEALLRWRHPDMGLISPARFIPVAEATGLVLPIGQWVLRNVAACQKRWLEQGLPPTVVSVNLSPVQLRQHNIDEAIESIMLEFGLPPGLLEVEITEGAVMEEPEQAVSTLRRLKETGISVAIDDFGVGYSSLSYLKRFPVDHLKIDQSFVRAMTEDDGNSALVLAVIMIAHSVGLNVVAEGVETRKQLDQLINMGCEEAQGYLFSRPIEEEDVPELLRRGVIGPADTDQSSII